jgi:Na+-transporting NADH:ubiquinone oxidoreductase subunit NqrF
VKERRIADRRTPEVFGIKKWECEVVSNHNVATFIKEIVCQLPEGEALDVKSGGIYNRRSSGEVTMARISC